MSDEEGFHSVAERTRQEVFAFAQGIRAAAEPYDPAVQAVLLGAMASICDLWADIANQSVTRQRFIEVMRESISDFAGQAYDNHKGGSVQ